MKNYYVRTREIANYIIEHNATIRATANVFNMAKSTVHYDLSFRLPYIDFELFEKVKGVLDVNFSQKHLRGGEATRKKYLNKSNKK